MGLEVVEAGRDVFLVVGPETNWCLIRDGGSVTLVDAAWPKHHSLVVESLARIGAIPSQVDAVVLTHGHPDHSGVAERFRSDHGSTVHTHRAEVGHATGQYRERARVIDFAMRLWRPSVVLLTLAAIRGGGLQPKSVAEVTPFTEGRLDVPGRPVAVPTPGHTSGHCSFHLPNDGIVITGDALVSRNLLTGRSGARLMPRMFTHDLQQAVASLDQLADLHAEVLLPGHGELLHMSPADAVDQARHRLDIGGWWDR